MQVTIKDLVEELFYTHPVHGKTRSVLEAAVAIETEYAKKIEGLTSQVKSLENKAGALRENVQNDFENFVD